MAPAVAAAAASAAQPSSLSLAAPAPAPSAPSDAEAREKPDRAQERPVAASSKRDYKGFVAGVFSGIAKLTGKRKTPPPFSLFTLCSSG